jgi:hypothetical protein
VPNHLLGAAQAAKWHQTSHEYQALVREGATERRRVHVWEPRSCQDMGEVTSPLMQSSGV